MGWKKDLEVIERRVWDLCGTRWNVVERSWSLRAASASLEDGVVGGTLVGLHVLDGVLELLALLVPLVDGHEQQLLVHFAAHDEEVGAQGVELGARAVGAVLDVERQLLQVLLPQHALLQHLLLLLRRDQLPVALLLLHLLDFHLQG